MSSKRAKRRRSCESKVRHAAKADAAAHARAIGGARFPYRCEFCGGWHVGRSSRRQIQRRRAIARDRKGNA